MANPTSFTKGIFVSVDLEATIAKKGGGSYTGVRFAYRDADGNLKEQLMHSNVVKFNPSFGGVLETLKAGDHFTMRKEKENDYWNPKEITIGDAEMATTSGGAGIEGAAKEYKGAPAPRNNYETKEERAIRQRLIVAQSSLTTALACLSDADKMKERKVFDTADKIFNWVFSHGEQDEDAPVENAEII